MRKLILTVLLINIIFAGLGTAGQLDSQMDKIVQTFIKDAEARSPGLIKETLAVFPFNCDEKLARKRVDLAVSELLTSHILKSGTFKLIERSRIDTILKEQELGQTGIIDTETAVKVGKVLGARLMVLGNVARIGRSYQISSRLVDAQSSEIISASIVEVPVETFNEEASRYLVIVPETQTLGVYFTFLYMPASVTKLSPATYYGITFTPAPVQAPVSFASLGLGLRYWPLKRIMVDACFFLFTGYSGKSLSNFTVSAEHFDTKDISESLTGNMLKISANWVQPISGILYAYAGIGVWVSMLSFNNGEKTDNIRVTNPAGETVEIRLPGKSQSPVTPLMRFGLELRPQQRSGIGLFANLSLPRKYKYDISIYKFYNTGGDNWTFSPEEKMTVREIVLFTLDLELTLSFYF
ncbi:MAG: CsgG/HfaB family protein [bacterium]|nr:CsgG/HfaB family protein [bacterium]